MTLLVFFVAMLIYQLHTVDEQIVHLVKERLSILHRYQIENRGSDCVGKSGEAESIDAIVRKFLDQFTLRKQDV